MIAHIFLIMANENVRCDIHLLTQTNILHCSCKVGIHKTTRTLIIKINSTLHVKHMQIRKITTEMCK